MTADLILLSCGLLLVLIGNGAAAAARAAVVQSHPAALRARQEAGSPGAQVALELASGATSLLLSFRALHYLSRLAAVGLGVGVWLRAGSPGGMAALAGVVAGAGLAAPLAEFLGEAVALRSPEATAERLSFLASLTVAVMAPLRPVHAWLTRSSEGRMGMVPPLVTEEEIKTLVDAGEEGGAIEIEEKKMIFSVFELGDTLAREVMVPRIDIMAFNESQPLEDVADALLASGHSRAPVFRADIDSVIGIVYVKDLLKAVRQGREKEPVGAWVRPALFVPEAKKADDLLADLQARRIHMAVVVDEYGGTAGVVTLEDLVEEIVGEIRDEYDAAEEVAFQEVRDGEYLLSGRMDLDDVNQLTGSRLPKGFSDTLGGFISGRLGRVPSSGDVVEAGGLSLVVEQSTGHRILKVRARRSAVEEEAEGNGDHPR
jgi:CBS domain containing-hemolysin-like protein